MKDVPSNHSLSSPTQMKEETSSAGAVTPASGHFKSCPIRMDSIRNSLQASIASKRGSMTVTEIQFVQNMMESKDLNEDDLTQMNQALQCDKLFFVPDDNNDDKKRDDEQEIRSSSSIFSRETLDKPPAIHKPGPNQRAISLTELPLGSKKRQEKLEARKKQAAAQAKQRAARLWKKASTAAKVIARMSGSVATTTPPTHQRSVSLPNNATTAARFATHRGSTLSTISALTIDESPSEEEEKLPQQGSMPSVPEDDGSASSEDKGIQVPEPKARPVFLREASVNVYGGEGFEIGAEFLDEKKSEESLIDDDESEIDEDELEDQIRALGFESRNSQSLSTNSPGIGFRRASVNIYGGSGFEVAAEELLEEIYDTDGSHKVEEHYDPWLYQETDEQGHKRSNLKILGTSHDDIECHPHVLSPIQMDRLQPYLPNTKQGESLWLKYSLVRDGASPIAFLQQVRASPCTLLAMETVDGEVFGGFFTQPWTVQSGYFGTGESFLWRMKHRRHLPEEFHPPHGDGNVNDSFTSTNTIGSLAEQIEREADLEVFRSEAFYVNDMFQLCTQDSIASGGGSTSFPKDFGDGEVYSPEHIGFGLILGGSGTSSLLEGSSSACLTYRSPPLSHVHADGSRFELINLEAWGFTPCQTEEEARILEYKNMFFKRHASGPF